jgi:ATP-dependent DNA helicase RecG
MALAPDTELRYLKGVGPRRADELRAQRIETVEDLLYHVPFRYEDRRSFATLGELVPGGDEKTVSVEVVSSRLIRTRRRGFTIFEAAVRDASGTARAVWYNRPYLDQVFVPGRRVVLFARLIRDRYDRPVLDNPEHEVLDDDETEGIHTGRIVPVYRKLGEMTSRTLRRTVFHALEALEAGALPPTVPDDVARRHGVSNDRLDALRAVHFPPPDADIASIAERCSPAHRALVFEEAFVLQLALAVRRRGIEREERGATYEIPDALRTRLAGILPFPLTGAQKRVLREIGDDLRAAHPMNRLLQGDVGSGKTIVALLVLLVAIENGFQAALMAPTEILAEQHDRNVRALLAQGGIDCRVALVTGSLKAGERRRALEDLRSGTAKLAIGTHALFESGVAFRKLGLVVVDEQHRFGVLQRAALAEKGVRPDVLVMTATPIPRSLALTLYGDLDLSVIDEMPPGRTPVKTVVRTEADRERVWDGVRREVARGRQAFVVAPLVEETEKSDLKAAESLAEELRRGAFRDLRVGLVHGRMKGEVKDETMRAFAAGTIDVLVATTVIEVGVDVPNATVMVVEHAERFGLSQLHQLRGRVGRGDERSYCVLMVGTGEPGAVARERLRVLERSHDGFRIAERDLELRGPGAVFGTQQHGLTDLKFLAVMLSEPGLVDAARAEAKRILAEGAAGEKRARAILDALGPRWRSRFDLARVG